MRKPLLLAAALAVLAGGGFAVYTFVLAPKPNAYVPPKNEPAPLRTDIAVPGVTFTDVTPTAGIAFRHTNGAAGKKLLPETMGPGVCVLDYDADGRQDLLFVNGCPWPGHKGPDKPPCLALYRNKGDGTFADVTDAAGLRVTLFGMGACAGDIDNDGFPDLFVTAVGGNKLFRNVPAGAGRRFEDATAAAGLPGSTWPGSLSAADFLARKEPIPFGTSATFLDYDGDADLDLFVCHYVTWSPAFDLAVTATLTGIGRAYLQPQQFEGAQCTLYRNAGGKFEDVSAAAGVTVVEKEGIGANARLRNVGKSLGVVVCDPDADGWPDLVVANDTVRNFFFHNVPDGKGGRAFTEDAILANAAYADGRARGAMGIDWGEYLPGQNGVVITNFANEPNTLLRVLDDPKRPRFTDVAQAYGLAGPSRFPLKFGAFFFDYDLDGRPDLLTCNGHLEPEISKNQAGQEYAQPPQLFWNTGSRGRLFEPVTSALAGPDLFEPVVGRGSAFLDYDGDGDLDVVLCENNGPARLLRNDTKLGNKWVRLVLVGDGKRSNRSGIGAQITIAAGEKAVRRDVAGARGYLSQSEFPVTVGLGAAGAADKVTVRWPGKDAGEPQVWTNLEVGKTYTLTQGVTEARPN